MSNESSPIAIGLIPEATNRKPVKLIEVEPVDTATEIVQVAEPGVSRKVLCRTPPVAEAANIGECPTVVTEAARQAGKTAAIRSSSIWVQPMCDTRFFHCPTSYTFTS